MIDCLCFDTSSWPDRGGRHLFEWFVLIGYNDKINVVCGDETDARGVCVLTQLSCWQPRSLQDTCK